jgi:hypothetical protein
MSGADSLVRHERLIRNQEVEGSNPSQSICHQETNRKCPKTLKFITKHTWLEAETRHSLATGKDDIFLFLCPYTNFRLCMVCGEIQGYYQGGASAGWEPLNFSEKDRAFILANYLSKNQVEAKT